MNLHNVKKHVLDINSEKPVLERIDSQAVKIPVFFVFLLVGLILVCIPKIRFVLYLEVPTGVEK
jgi:lysozyme family protein